MAFVSPGQPWNNGFVESLHNRMRDELREDNLFEDLTHARVMVDWRSRRYNSEHPHSVLGYLSPGRYAENWKKKQQAVA